MSAAKVPIPQNYGIAAWGEGYFTINDAGHVAVRPHTQHDVELDLYELAGHLTDSGLRLPVLVRFNDLLQRRVRELCGAFAAAAEQLTTWAERSGAEIVRGAEGGDLVVAGDLDRDGLPELLFADTPETATETLIEAANEAAGLDNISVIVAEVQP